MRGSVEHWISLDLSSPRGTIALADVENDRVSAVSEHEVGAQFDHCEKLIDSLDTLLLERSLSLKHIDRWITPSGPGSFTGLRIAYATLKAFAMTSHKPVDTVSSHEARFLSWKDKNRDASGPVQVITTVSGIKAVKTSFDGKTGDSLEELLVETAELEKNLSGIVLLDRESRQITSYPVQRLPLSAGMLPAILLRARTRETHTDLAQWISLSPRYFGTSKFGAAS